MRLVTVHDLHAASVERRADEAAMTGEAAFAVLESLMRHLDPVVATAFQPVTTALAPRFPLDA